MPGYFSLEK